MLEAENDESCGVSRGSAIYKRNLTLSAIEIPFLDVRIRGKKKKKKHI